MPRSVTAELEGRKRGLVVCSDKTERAEIEAEKERERKKREKKFEIAASIQEREREREGRGRKGRVVCGVYARIQWRGPPGEEEEPGEQKRRINCRSRRRRSRCDLRV